MAYAIRAGTVRSRSPRPPVELSYAASGPGSDKATDLDLLVFNCTSGTCVQAGSSANGDSEESVTINNPAAGTWVVLVDGFAVPAGTTTYEYVDVFTNPAFGTVAATDADALRPAGSNWTAPGTVTANEAPAAGRTLLGAVQVRTDANVLVAATWWSRTCSRPGRLQRTAATRILVAAVRVPSQRTSHVRRLAYRGRQPPR